MVFYSAKRLQRCGEVMAGTPRMALIRMTDAAIVIKTSETKRPARGARSSALLVAAFLAVIVEIGWAMPLIVVCALSLLASFADGSDQQANGSLTLASAFGAASLGLAWISMAHLARRAAVCAALQIAAVSAFSASLLLYAVSSSSPLLTWVTAAPFAFTAAVKLTGARRLISARTRQDWQFSLRELLCLLLSLCAFIIPVGRAVRAPTTNELDPKTTAVVLTAYGSAGEVIEEKRLSYPDYVAVGSPLMDSDVYRAEHGITRILESVVTPTGVRSAYENVYASDGAFTSGRQIVTPRRRDN